MAFDFTLNIIDLIALIVTIAALILGIIIAGNTHTTATVTTKLHEEAQRTNSQLSQLNKTYVKMVQERRV